MGAGAGADIKSPKNGSQELGAGPFKVESQNFLDPILLQKPSFWGSFELLMLYYVKPRSVFLKPSFY